MTRLILAAGVAALAIATPAAAKPGGGGGGGNPHGNGGGGNPHAGGGAPAVAPQGGGGGHGHGGGGGGGGAPAFVGGGGHGHGGGGFAPIYSGGGGGRGHGGGGFAAPRQQSRSFAGRGGGHGHAQSVAVNRGGQRHGHGGQAVASGGGRGHGHAGALAPQQSRGSARQQDRMAQKAAHGRELRQQQAQNGFAQRDARQADRLAQVQQRVANNPVAAERIAAFRNADTSFAGNGTRGLIDGCPPGLWMKNNGCMPPGQAAKLLGTPFAQASGLVPMSVLPQPLSYLYPDTSDYYYRYGDGYLYQVDRGTNLIASLLPLIGGGYVPGQYLPQPYMASYVPDYYGLNSFYPDYGDTCNRYANGVIYEVDCMTGYVEDVIPMYAGGYGVGQMLPSAYSYYNVPMQYRSLYYDTPDYGYWYAPGAIYQYDQRSNLITSVAALMTPGFTVGQALPLGYDVYNVPYDYRATYYDTPNAWYRYNNGYIYQVDPVTQVVTAIVASLLT